jgi:hypothetical protein
MWEGIDAGTYSKDNLTWIAEGMTNGTLIWMTDRSYDRKKAAYLSGVRWIIFCSQTGMHISRNFWEQSLTGSSFRAEMLGLCALHLLARAISEYYELYRWTSTLCCNNKRALLLSSRHRGRIRPSTKCADIRQSFRATKQTYNRGFTYIHVYGHMDQHLSWLQLNLPQQLN